MTFFTVFNYTQSINSSLVIEYFYKGEKIEDPATFFEQNQGFYKLHFPSFEETQAAINNYLLFSETHKLVISEYGFHLIHL